MPANALGIEVELVGRLARDATLDQAEGELSGIARGLAVVPAGTSTQPAAGVRVHQVRDEFTSDDLMLLAGFLTVVGFVVLLAATNVANLLLAPATTRRQEIGARLSLGASRGRVIRQLLTESALLGVLASAAGLIVASWFTPFGAGPRPGAA